MALHFTPVRGPREQKPPPARVHIEHTPGRRRHVRAGDGLAYRGQAQVSCEVAPVVEDADRAHVVRKPAPVRRIEERGEPATLPHPAVYDGRRAVEELMPGYHAVDVLACVPECTEPVPVAGSGLDRNHDRARKKAPRIPVGLFAIPGQVAGHEVAGRVADAAHHGLVDAVFLEVAPQREGDAVRRAGVPGPVFDPLRVSR
ncbi:MAG TPA: hypothetical protein PK307_13050, partial [Spirochaetota bacterium]|nr:hypothetical protein [Spirochaetota bacterium]